MNGLRDLFTPARVVQKMLPQPFSRHECDSVAELTGLLAPYGKAKNFHNLYGSFARMLRDVAGTPHEKTNLMRRSADCGFRSVRDVR